MNSCSELLIRNFPLVRMLAGLCAVLIIMESGFADDSSEQQRIFLRGIEMFDQAQTADDYRAAARELERITEEGFENGAVYYNLGNAWFRAGEFGRAILNYRKAKPYRPRDAYLEANLQQALLSAPGRLPEQPKPWWIHVFFWSDWLSYPARVRIFGTSLALSAFVSMMAALLQRHRFHWVSAGLAGLSLFLGTESWLSNPDSWNRIRAVITAETEARKGTGKDYEPAFDQPLRDGAEFTVLGETPGWTFGHFEGIGDGWVRNECVAR